MKELQQQRRSSGPLSRLAELEEPSETEASTTDENSDPTTSNGSTRLPVIMERRPSLVKKRTSSFNEASQEMSTQRRSSITGSNPALLATRRASIPQGSNPVPSPLAIRRGSKSQPLFANIGRRVSTLVRARLAFQRRPSKSSSSSDSEPEVNPMEVIHELPRNPRFSSFLSPEAQYALMKGYEDKLYEDLSGSFPESAVGLKRNKTPHHKISIRGQSPSNKSGMGDDKIDEEGDDKSENSHSSSFNGPSQHGATPAATHPSSFYITSSPSFNTSTSISSFGRSSSDRGSPMSTSTSSSHPQSPTPSPFLRPIGRRGTIHDVNRNSLMSPNSVASHNAMTSSMTQMASAQYPLQRSNSLPVLPGAGLPLDRRLVLSYRLESAMDILDTLRRRKGEYSLSPRVVKNSRPITPVRDFNSWASVWGKEFKEVPAN